jgi:hypothetical protein
MPSPAESESRKPRVQFLAQHSGRSRETRCGKFHQPCTPQLKHTLDVCVTAAFAERMSSKSDPVSGTKPGSLPAMSPSKPLPLAAQRALAEAQARREALAD